MSFLQGHKYFHKTPYCFHIILRPTPNDNERERETMHPLSGDSHASVYTHILQKLEKVYLHHERPAAETGPPDFAFKTAH